MSRRHRILSAALTSALALFASIPALSQSITCTYTSFEGNPQANLGSGANGLNDVDAAVGTWTHFFNTDSSVTHGFLRAPAGKITDIYHPKSYVTYPTGINDNETVVGYYQNTQHNSAADGFTWKNGVFTPLQYPNSVYTEPEGINRNGEIVGWYAVGANPGVGFLYSAGHFTTISYPGAFVTVATGVNNLGEIVGWWSDTNGTQSAFIYNNGTYQTVFYPGGTGTEFTAVNDSGEIGGFYFAPGPDQNPYGFIYTNGTFKLLTISNTNDNIVFGLNGKGDVSGVYQTVQFGTTTAFIGTNCH